MKSKYFTWRGEYSCAIYKQNTLECELCGLSYILPILKAE